MSVTPIKRSSALAPLSREHHEGLLFVWKIRQGIKKDIHPERILAYVKWFWENELQPHFRKEEKVLLPVLEKFPNLKARLWQEHSIIHDHINIVLHNSYHETFENLAHTVNDHIRFEERILFNEVEKTVSTETLSEIEKQLAKPKNQCAAWKDEFWLEK